MASPATTRVQHPTGLELASPRGERRGCVEPKQVEGRAVLEELWILQGSWCDLRCTHCYVDSSALNNHLEQIAFEELRPHLDEARCYGVRRIYFTGGEPFFNHDVLLGRNRHHTEFVQSLRYALEIAPVEILTNARFYIRNHFDVLEELHRKHGDRLRLRVTLESPRAEEHDAIRGKTTFEQTLTSLAELSRLGLVPVVTAERPFLSEQSDEEIRAAYEAVLGARGIRAEITVINNLMEMGRQLVQIEKQGGQPHGEVFVTEHCFETLQKPAETLMCHFSRSIQKIEGELRYYPCPVIYNDARYDLGATVADALRPVYIAHKNCYDYCMKGGGASCRTQVI